MDINEVLLKQNTGLLEGITGYLLIQYLYNGINLTASKVRQYRWALSSSVLIQLIKSCINEFRIEYI